MLDKTATTFSYNFSFSLPPFLPPSLPPSLLLSPLDICRCEAQYDYEGQQSDELSIQPGDVIYVTEKIDDDWWQGNLNGTIGIFPANYVDVLENY